VSQKFNVDHIVLQFDLSMPVVLHIESKTNSMLCSESVVVLLVPCL